ncbi:MAG TPA: peptidoglycan DD-metalloendopeptidase family protein [Gemmatimonadales bacterium]|nr:peptidoglycan DD-metalloendopeptidase family protein [Gemmatimonadales bacterium]
MFERPARFLILLVLAAVPLAPVHAQQDLDESRRRLEAVRQERERLELERIRLQGQVHDLGQELDNLERQRQTTNRIVNELEKQIGGLNEHIDRASADLALAQDNLAEKRAVLARRLAEIYKRGRLYTFEVLVSAQSFGDLLSRYKYLYLQSRQDQALVDDVERLKNQVQRRREEIIQIRAQLDQSREDRQAELQRYGQLVEERAQRLQETRRSARNTEQKLTALQRDEADLNDLLQRLEAARRTAEARNPRASTATTASLTTADIGKLDWPVDGKILYDFGREQLPSGAVIKRNGIGIGAPLGTPVRAVESGTVERLQTMGTYGLVLILSHGDGYRSLYMHLQEAKVSLGAKVTKGQIIGTVGGENSDEGPHLYFEIRGEGGIPLNPSDWLKRRR